jgi:alpha-L-fucosidase
MIALHPRGRGHLKGDRCYSSLVKNHLSVHRSLCIFMLLGGVLASPHPLLCGETNHPVASIQDTETQAQRSARMSRWRGARFGMFIHWGLYAVPAGTWQGKQVPSIGE